MDVTTGKGPAPVAEGEPLQTLQASTAYRSALLVALGYVVVATVWIFLSDLVLLTIPSDSSWLLFVSLLKGWSFVLVTGGLLYVLLRQHARRILDAERAYRIAVERAEQQKRLFFQNTITAITEGKMLVRSPGALAAMPTPPQMEEDVVSAAQASGVREKIREAALAAGIRDERAADLVVAAGEAITNAIKHANGGRVSVHVGADCVWVRVTDHGPGIADLMLPRVVLERGYSTKPSLGMGYTLMLALSDRLYLTTGPTGTTVVLEMCRREGKAATVAAIPDRTPLVDAL